MEETSERQCVSDVAVCTNGCTEPCVGCCAFGRSPASREGRLRRQAWLLTVFTIAWNLVESGIAISSGLAAGSIALVGFGLDSIVETSSAVIIAWRLSRQGPDDESNENAERRAVRLIALTFFAIAAYVGYDAVAKLLGLGERPEPSGVGLLVVSVSLVIMPGVAWAKRYIAEGLDSVALKADAAETLICAYLSGVVLLGLAANAVFGWWWMDSIAGLIVAVMAVREGREAWSGGELFEEENEKAPAAAACSALCCPACPLAWAASIREERELSRTPGLTL